MSNKRTVMITGDRGFIGTYLVSKFLKEGWRVLGVDNEEKYGPTAKAHDKTSGYLRAKADLTMSHTHHILSDLIKKYDVELIIAGAAKIGGIKYFHDLPYTLLSANELILNTTFGAAIKSFLNQETLFSEKGRVVVISSSMVYEAVPIEKMPVHEEDVFKYPPPPSSYGFQKLASEYWAKAAFDEFGLPYTIVRPFNCFGTGELRALETEETLVGDVKMSLSHVIPDLMQKVIRGQYPVQILGDGNQVRQFTHGSDLANGIFLASTNPHALLQDFNFTSERNTSVLELLSMILDIAGLPFDYVTSPPFEYDVQYRSASSAKAKEILGWAPKKSLEEELPGIYKWIAEQVSKGKM